MGFNLMLVESKYFDCVELSVDKLANLVHREFKPAAFRNRCIV